jgi:hypothetical protein
MLHYVHLELRLHYKRVEGHYMHATLHAVHEVEIHVLRYTRTGGMLEKILYTIIVYNVTLN